VLQPVPFDNTLTNILFGLDAYVDVQNLTNRRTWYTDVWDRYRRSSFKIVTLGRLPSAGANWVF